MGTKQMDDFKVLNLNKEPFSNSPDPDFFFKSHQHYSCLQKIEISLRLRRGLNVVVGDLGAGKTTLCRQLIRNFADDKDYETHLILDPQFRSPSEFLGAVVEMFEGALPLEVSDEWQAKELIKRYLFRKGVDEKKAVILIIDEGQKLAPFCLEILREFLNYETNEYKLLQIAIFAQKDFEKTLKKYANFADRINLYHELGPLNFQDTRLMIQYRLNQASQGAKAPTFFSYAAVWAIFRSTAGYPLKIINLCQRCLLTMIIQNRNKIGWLLVRSCVKRVHHKRQKRLWRMIPVVLLTVFFAVALTAILSPDRLQVPLVWKAKELQLPPVPQKVAHSPISTEKISIALSSSSVPKQESKDNSSSSSETDSSKNSPTPLVQLETIRGWNHGNFFRIVFQFTEKVLYEKPIIHTNEAMVRLNKVTTELTSFRKYKTFGSWVRLEKNGNDLNVRIGFPEKSLKLHYFEIENPFRLVINIFTKGQFAQTIS